MNNYNRVLLLILLTFQIISSSGCQRTLESEVTPTDSATVNKIVLPTAFQSAAPTPSSTSTLKARVTPVDTIAITDTPTPYLLPTLLPTEAAIRVQELMKTNGGCQFPCWWGITPGVTTWGDTYNLLMPLSYKDNLLNTNVYISNVMSNVSFSAGMGFRVGKEEIGQGYIIRNNIVDFIEIRFGDAPSYTLSDLLTTYGTPEEVWISTINQDVQGVVPFDLLLGYPSKGILAYFHSMDAKIQGGQVQKCFRDDPAIVLDLWSPDKNKNVEQISTEAPFFGDMIAFDKFQPLATTTNLDTKTFGEIFRVPNHTSCVNTPTKFWKSPFE
jgi:hypothetical protein